MPHKHTRHKRDLDLFDLPPTRIARSLKTGPAPKETTRLKTSTTKSKLAKHGVADEGMVVDSTGTDAHVAEIDGEPKQKKKKQGAAGGGKSADKSADKSAGGKRAQDALDDEAKTEKHTIMMRAVKRKQNLNSVSVAAGSDTPRAFRRLMAVAGGKRLRSGLDDGVVETKKQKKERRKKEAEVEAQAAAAVTAAASSGTGEADEGTDEGADEGAGEVEDEDTAAATPAAKAATAAENADTAETAETDGATAEVLKIRPGERLADFARRVDAALPLTGLTTKSLPGGGRGKDPLGIVKAYQTRRERKMHRLYDQWRAEERKIQERRAEAQEEAEARDDELDDVLGVKWRLDFEQSGAKKTGASGGGKKKHKKNNAGGAANHLAAGDDVWAEFNRRKSAATKSTVVAGIHGVATAPPERLTQVDSSKFRFAQHKKADGSGKGSAEVAAAVARLHGLQEDASGRRDSHGRRAQTDRGNRKRRRGEQ